MLRQHKVGYRLALSHSSHQRYSVFSEWVAYMNGTQTYRKSRRSLKARQISVALKRIFTAWLIMVAEAWHVSIRATEKIHEVLRCPSNNYLGLF